ncbi:hypothetical protein Tco_0546936 [Tanacetum coccineum]
MANHYKINVKIKFMGHDLKEKLMFAVKDTCRRQPYASNETGEKVQKGNYGCNGPIPQVLNHTSPKNLKPKSRSANRVGNHKPRIPQPGSIGRYQNKTIGRRDKQQQERQSDKQGTKGKTKLQPQS